MEAGLSVSFQDAVSVLAGQPVSPGSLLECQTVGLCPDLRSQSLPFNRISRFWHLPCSLGRTAPRNTGVHNSVGLPGPWPGSTKTSPLVQINKRDLIMH